MLNPALINKMKKDFTLLMNGFDGCNAVLTWANPGVGEIIDPVYGTVSGGPAVTGTLTSRCHVNKVFGEGEIKGKGLADVVPGDAIVLFPNTLDLTGKGTLQIALPNMGVWYPVTQPPAVFQQYARLLVNNGESFVQAVYIRRATTT